MGGFFTNIRDPVYILDSTLSIITDIVGEVHSEVVLWHVERPIVDIQERIDTLKKEFPEKYKSASGAEAKKTEKNNYERDLRTRLGEIKDLKILQDKLELSFLYMDMGLQTAFADFMMVYGVAAKDTPSISLKGSGDIVMKADASKNLYVSQNFVGGSPKGFIDERIDVVKVIAHSLTKMSKWVTDGQRLKDETNVHNQAVKDQERARVTKTAAKNKAAEDSNKKSDAYNKAIETAINENKPTE